MAQAAACDQTNIACMTDADGRMVDALKAAVAAVEEAEVPQDLRPAAFSAAFHSSSIAIPPKAAQPGTASAERAEPPAAGGVERIAQKLDLNVEQVAAVYDVDEDGVHLMVRRDALNPTKKFAQQEVTYLLVAGRQAAGLEEWTPARTAIEATHDRGVHDTNVSKAIAALDGDGLRFRGSGSKREIKMNSVGFSRASAILRRISEAS